jgi:hypothetical protein
MNKGRSPLVFFPFLDRADFGSQPVADVREAG